MQTMHLWAMISNNFFSIQLELVPIVNIKLFTLVSIKCDPLFEFGFQFSQIMVNIIYYINPKIITLRHVTG